jgi:predicted dehydrogenase
VGGTPDQPPLRWGIAGYGDVVVRRALPALAALGQKVAGIWGRNPERAAETARRYGAGSGFSCFDSLLEAADLVYIATPVVDHVPLAELALRAGRPVLVEKPLAGGLPCGQTLLTAGAGGSPTGAVAYYRRLAPAWLAVTDLARDRRPVRIAISFRKAFSPEKENPKYWRTRSEISGGGVLADAGCHRIDLLYSLLGPPATCRATLAGRYPSGAERAARLELSWTDGSRARLSCEWAASGPERDSLRITGRGLDLRLPNLDAGIVTVLADRTRSQRRLPPEPNGLLPTLRDFLACLATGREPACALADGVAVDDIIRSAYRGQPVVTAR